MALCAMKIAPHRGCQHRTPLTGPSCRSQRPSFAFRSAPPQSRRTRRCAPLCSHQDLYHTNDEPVSSFGYATDFEQRYTLGEQVGSGTFGTVFVATEAATGQRLAVKRMPKRFGPGGSLERYFVRRVRNEVDICNHLGRSLNVAYMYGAFEDAQSVSLVMELCTGGELWDRIKRRGEAYSEQDAARMVREMLRTVAQCHAAGVLMRDVKPENFLFATSAEDAPLKAIDFGVSVFCEADQWVDVKAGTPIYIAPEVLRSRYSLGADVWGVGVVAYQLLTGRLPFAGEEGAEVAETYMSTQTYVNKDVFRAVLYADLDFESPPWDTLSPAALDLVRALLTRDPLQRPTAEQALQHEWLRDGGAAPSQAPLGDSIVSRLQRYGTYGRLKQAALRKVAAAAAGQGDSSLPVALSAAFARMDPGSTGRVPLAELRSELEGGHFALTPGEAGQLLAQVDADDDGSVSYADWVAAMADWNTISATADWEALVTKAFHTLDRDEDNSLGASDLEELLCGEQGCELSDFVDAALREADGDRDGALSLEEFKALLTEHDADLSLFDARVAAPQGSSSSSDSGGSSAMAGGGQSSISPPESTE